MLGDPVCAGEEGVTKNLVHAGIWDEPRALCVLGVGVNLVACVCSVNTLPLCHI